MSGRFAGSKSLDERRRRRLAVDDRSNEKQTTAADAEPARPLPARRPTGRFPLGRIVSRSPWKLAFTSLLVVLLCGVAVGAGQSPAIRAGQYGPGVTAYFSEAGRLTTVCGGVLLLATGQLAWLICWARARSLRDFRGQYRIWRRTAFAATTAGLVLLTDAHSAFAATVAWATSKHGLEAYARLLPGLLAIVLLIPALQRETRGCETSRVFLLVSSVLWLCGLLTIAAETSLASLIARIGWVLSTVPVQQGLLLGGTAAAFSGILFHARHVIYESAEPPQLPARRKKVAAVEIEAEESVEKELATEAKPKRTASRRSRRAEEAPAAETTVKEEPQAKPIAKPHFSVKAEAPSKTDVKPAAKIEASVAPPTQAPELPKPAPKAAPQQPARPEPVEEDDDGMVEFNGRQVRLDGPEDALRGMSKRDRRKLRKAMKERDRAGV